MTAQGVAAVIGWPVSHSLSPALHNYWLAEHHLPGNYVALPIEPEHLREMLPTLPMLGLKGVNLTLPHKERVLPLLASADDTARAIGAANTLIFNADGSIHGTNTDAYGFMENIRPHLTGKGKAVMLGAGGAGRAVAYALREEGFDVTIINRSLEKAQNLADAFGLTAQPWEWRGRALAGADLLVNATSLGMKGQGELDLDLAALPSHALVTDIVYSPLVTPLLVAALARGNPVVDGLGMLLHQAVPAFEAWFGVRPEVTPALRAHVLAAKI
jgi:shikimate dehydrogenase